jgi:hypothetical protein
MKSPIFYHEDFYRQIELVPEENYFATGRFINSLPLEQDSMYGSYNITIRPEQKIKLLDRNISIEEIRNLLNPISLLYSENIQTGYGQSSAKAKNIIAWGFEQFGIFVTHRGSFVEAIWLCDSSAFPQIKTGHYLSQAIFSISKSYSLILIDWNKEKIFRFRSEDDVKKYLFQNLSFSHY